MGQEVTLQLYSRLLFVIGGRKGAAVLCELVPGQLREPPQDNSYNYPSNRGQPSGYPGYPAYPSYNANDGGYPDYNQGRG